MKIIISENGKKKIQISKKEWKQIGKTAYWGDHRKKFKPNAHLSHQCEECGTAYHCSKCNGSEVDVSEDGVLHCRKCGEDTQLERRDMSKYIFGLD